MGKIIWHIREDGWLKEPVLEKEVVVYEKGDYLYCKRNDADELAKYSRNAIENDVTYIITSGKGKEDVIKRKLQEAKASHRRKTLDYWIAKYKRDSVAQQNNLNWLNDKIASLQNDLNELNQSLVL